MAVTRFAVALLVVAAVDRCLCNAVIDGKVTKLEQKAKAQGELLRTLESKLSNLVSVVSACADL